MLVLKQGKEGCKIYSSKKKDSIFIPFFKIEEVDPTGAGDYFNASFLYVHLEEKDLYECGVQANACDTQNSTKFRPMEGVFRRNMLNNFIENNKL